jgi:hypothetical protein
MKKLDMPDSGIIIAQADDALESPILLALWVFSGDA